MKDTSVFVVELRQLVNGAWRLRNEGTLLEQRENLFETVLRSISRDIFEQLVLGNARERIFDPRSRS
jgi:hypothetical protein